MTDIFMLPLTKQVNLIKKEDEREYELTWACFMQSAIMDSRATRDQEKGGMRTERNFAGGDLTCWNCTA